MRHYRHGAHTKTDLKAHVVWIPKYRKKVLIGPVAVRVRDFIRQIALEHERHIISGKVARDHVHVFLSYRPHQDLSTIVQWLKGISSCVLLQEFAHLRKKFWGRHFLVCDAEQIIYADIDRSDGNRVHYTMGSIEAPELNLHAINVLEGTRPAFDNRGSKYLPT